MDKLRDFDKVKKVIESCTTMAQMNVADHMIDNFIKLYGDDRPYIVSLSNIFIYHLSKIDQL